MTPRAIVFDLDDTLYHERRFALSGYRCVAESVQRESWASPDEAFRCLALSLRRGRRALAFQDLAARFGLPESSVPAWIERYRAHEPQLRLVPAVRRALERLRGRWRLGVLTNGLPAVQAAKVRALGLDRFVDAITFADNFGGKPDPRAFLEILSRLGCEPSRAVFAGDDRERDIEGARRVGMKTVLVDRRGCAAGRDRADWADAVVRRVTDVPAIADRLVSEDPLHVH